MRPQSFHNQMPPGRPFNQFQVPRGNFGTRPTRFPQPGMMPPPGRGPSAIPGIGRGTGRGPSAIPGIGLGTGGGTPKIQSFMDTANRFLATAQSFQPFVQQATPMFRNLPALWRLYKGFQGLPKTGDSKEHDQREEFNLDDSSEIQESFVGPERFKNQDPPARKEKFARPARKERYEEFELSESPTYTEKVRPKKEATRPSIPRIFQPPYHFDE